MIQATGVILAGGKSKRMGSDKAFLEVGEAAMIKQVASELKKVCNEVLIAGGTKENGELLGLNVIPDRIPGRGPLSGIHAALLGAANPKCLVTACDMPFVTAALALFMINQADGYDVAVPTHGIHMQPLFAVYDRNCVTPIEQALLNNRRKVAAFYPLVRVNYVNEKYLRAIADIDLAFFNVNTPDDLEKARAMAVRDETGA
ncbi:MAG: Molybdenum cofactor guanylyltransferase [Firmicutes bacterium ADurb.Bin456]|nr:MAG: Molybdenum cofactor guanylyltransferase [Firmicutes bacterium ADurb.Bin456]